MATLQMVGGLTLRITIMTYPSLAFMTLNRLNRKGELIKNQYY